MKWTPLTGIDCYSDSTKIPKSNWFRQTERSNNMSELTNIVNQLSYTNENLSLILKTLININLTLQKLSYNLYIRSTNENVANGMYEPDV